LVGLCPECGSDLRGRRSITVGHRRKLRRTGALAAVVLVAALSGTGLTIWGRSRGIDWNQYKPLWWLRLEAAHGSVDTVVSVMDEILARDAAGTLDGGGVEAVVRTMMRGVERGRLPPPYYAEPIAELMGSPKMPAAVRERVVSWIRDLQADPEKPWSVVLGKAYLAECIAKRRTPEEMEEFLRRSFSPRLVIPVPQPLRPGERVPVLAVLDFRGGPCQAHVWGESRGLDGDGVASYGTMCCLGTLRVPDGAGQFELKGTVTATINPDVDMVTGLFRNGLRAVDEPTVRRTWPVQLTYRVESGPARSPAVQEAAATVFWAQTASPTGRRGDLNVNLWAFMRERPVSAAFSAVWRYEGKDTPVGKGSLAFRTTSSSYSFFDTSGSGGGGSSTGTVRTSYFYQVPAPVGRGRAGKGTLILEFTEFAMEGGPIASSPFMLEFPIRLAW
jgi:hypothetical protein